MSEIEDHLNPEARAALDLSRDERIEYTLSPRWIGYTRSQQVLDRLDILLRHPKKHRMPNLLIVGETNNGKTMLVDRFLQRNPAYDAPDGDGVVKPVLMVQAPAVPDERRFYNNILESLMSSFRPSDNIDAKRIQTLSLIRSIRVRVLILDEIHNMLAGPINKQRQMYNALKNFGNDLGISIVGVGTREAHNALQIDPQLSNRFQTASLPKWSFDDEYLRLLASFERMLPLAEPSNLTDEPLSRKILALSEGIIGEISGLLTAAAIEGIQKGEERITTKLIDETIRSGQWAVPSDRRKAL